MISVLVVTVFYNKIVEKNYLNLDLEDFEK